VLLSALLARARNRRDLSNSAVFETNVVQPPLFDAVLRREPNHFCTRSISSRIRLRALKPRSPTSAKDVKEKVRDALAEITQTMSSGEHLLHSVGRFVPRKRLYSTSGAKICR
jgi:hypothetical protein